jgi:hypothetical protein
VYQDREWGTLHPVPDKICAFDDVLGTLNMGSVLHYIGTAV